MILQIEKVSVCYRTEGFREIGLKDYIINKWKYGNTARKIMAVKDVSFSLDAGDMLGIVGSNGAGKTTLLKVISGIMVPSAGKVNVNGTVAALLELGSGFDGELTVKENTYLRGAMMGYTRSFMKQRYREIIAFAELEEFQNMPFRQLSSGMRSRLAFAIASLVKPDILILDEVLSVGDGAFQKKSEQKMMEIISGEATTILVSHSLEQVRRLCNKVLWIDQGNQLAFGDTHVICDAYQQYLDERDRLSAENKKHPCNFEQQDYNY